MIIFYAKNKLYSQYYNNIYTHMYIDCECNQFIKLKLQHVNIFLRKKRIKILARYKIFKIKLYLEIIFLCII